MAEVGQDIEYKGDYLLDVGAQLVQVDGEKWKGVEKKEWLPRLRSISIDAMKALVRSDLCVLGSEFDNEVSESDLLSHGKVDAAVHSLELKGLVYQGRLEPPKGKADDWVARDQLLFRATQFGDEVDRPLQKSDGTWTYFASDIAYHLDKFERGYHQLVNVWGADHGGYISRVKAAVEALTDGTAGF